MGNLSVSFDKKIVLLTTPNILTRKSDSAGSDQRGDGHASPL